MATNPLQIALDERIAKFGHASYINLIDSNFHDNGFMLPPTILADGFSRYLAQRSYHPDSKGDIVARQAIASFYNEGGPVSRTSLDGPIAEASDIILTASSSESYNLLFQAFCEPGDNVLLPLPAYPLFEDLCRYNHLEARFYPLNEASGWQPDLDVLDSLCDERSRFVLLISPNNPCGSVLDRQSLEGVMTICHKRQVMVISDEVFSEFLYQTVELPRAAASQPHANTVPVFTINGISKLFACPDLKLSWIMITGPEVADESGFPDRRELIRELEIRNDTFLNCNSFSQFLLPRLFAESCDFVRQMTTHCAVNRELLRTKLMPNLPPGVRMNLPSGGIHFLISYSAYQGVDDETLAIKLLNETGLYLHPGYLYGMDDEPCLILSLLKGNQAFDQAIETLIQALGNYFD